MLLPSSLLLLVSTVLGQQSTIQLSLNQVLDATVNASSTSTPTVFSIPSSNGPLNISIALCTNQSPFPRFVLTNDTNNGTPKFGDTGKSIFNVTLDEGLGVWQGLAKNGGLLAAYPGDTSPGIVYPPWQIQVAVSDSSEFILSYIFKVAELSRFRFVTWNP